ncbi:gamma-glutamylcyclotransferase [Stenotrophomonas maltophilia]|uniref:gamma-glutamylcyclotransferase n=1 Tax=Stenotrophomonas maltophilia TaxID=40324 RepID=UPI001076B528|nr:gamma-glutamylcyclotransferase [Stenotrophomonas maltophilia]TFZ44667.1 gamma-glutamylcyclotransferase [Stenotrophomonas maltophilia]
MFDTELSSAVSLGAYSVSSPVLTRQLLEQGNLDALVAQDSCGSRVLSEADRQVSLRSVLARRPPGEVWVFAYGSLVWNPMLRAAERRIAQVDGWHRSFCFSITSLRATADQPGLMLGLERGGRCKGVAYRLEETDIEQELKLLWRREMACGAYVPRWVELSDESGGVLGSAIAFTIDRDLPQYAGDLDVDSVVHRLATAAGALGSCRDYLYRTCDALTNIGCQDQALDALAVLVHAVSGDRPWRE